MNVMTDSHVCVSESVPRARIRLHKRCVGLAAGLAAVVIPVAGVDAGRDAGDRPADLFTAPTGDYVIEFPGGQPEPVSNEMAGLPGSVEMDMFLSVAGTNAYMTARAEATDVPQSIDDAIDNAIGGIVGVGGTVERRDPVTFRGATGADVTGTITAQGLATNFLVRVLVRDTRVYMILVNSVGPVSLDDPEIGAFFGSFEFVKGVYR